MTHYRPPECCPDNPHPPLPAIPPGLRRLPRETAMFGGWRSALLSGLGAPLFAAPASPSPLAQWAADSEGDLGVMLIEFWAYVLDVLSFYDARIAERAYLGTANEARIAKEIVDLIGHIPRPALASAVELALHADGLADPVAVPARTRFLSEAFGSEPPQAFETPAAGTIWPQRNRWTFAPWRRPEFSVPLRLSPGESPSRGTVMLLANGATAAFAGRVAAVATEAASDGARYQLVKFEGGSSPQALAGASRDAISAFAMGLTTALSPFAAATDHVVDGTSSKALVLDSLYPQISEGSFAVIEASDSAGSTVFHAVRITHTRFDKDIPTGVTDINAKLGLSKIAFDLAESLAGKSIRVHLLPRLVGHPTRPAEAARTLADMRLAGALEAPATPLGSAPAGGRFVALGAAARGALLEGSISELGEAREFIPGAGEVEFAQPLLAPVALAGNVVTAVRGETVPAETVGSGNAALAWQRFRLKKKPLTWVADAHIAGGRSPQLDLFVDGIRWQWVETLYGRRGDERAFTIEMEPDGTAWVCGGDGSTGSRFPTGNGNIRASYRFGAGAAKPPPGSIKQIVRPGPGLLRVMSPLAPHGGADAETSFETAAAAPSGAQLLGRAVSAADFLAMARNFNGILNAAVSQGWDSRLLQPVIAIHFIADQGNPGPDLKEYLELRSLPGLPLSVAAAIAVPVSGFDISLELEPAFDPDKVRAAASAALFDPEMGMLAPRNIAIGAPLFRSAMTGALHLISGVRAVSAIIFDGVEMPYARVPGPGAWFDILPVGRVV